MSKIFNLFFVILILIFFYNIYKFYFSNKNLESIEFNRSNIELIINKKISNLPILDNDTDNVIEFNDGFSNEINDNKSRSFWNLLKFK
tara:strand:- start:836 stop:1099 length:264 start_codon:yes stop_codon:yes gene_type:complete